MLNNCNFNKESNPEIILNCSTLDIDCTEVYKIYPTLNTLTKLAITHIINSYKNLRYLLNKNIELSLVITNNFNISLVNFKWRGLTQATNVLSMRLMNPEDAKINPVFLLGDIVISIEKAKEEAELLTINYEDYLIILLIHGIVHICGFDHKNEQEAIIMKNIEDEILKIFNKNLNSLTENYWSK